MTNSWKLGWGPLDKPTYLEFRKGLGCIDDQTLGVAAASITIPASGVVPAGYAVLRINLHLRSVTAAATDTVALRFNGDTGNNYYSQLLRAAGATVTGSETGAVNLAHVGLVPGNTATGGHKGGYEIVIPNYTNTGDKKVGSSVGGAFDSSASGHLATEQRSFIWDDSGVAITSVTVLLTSGANIAVGSRVTTYVTGF